MDVVYHFTGCFVLPWIIASRELRPSRDKNDGFPNPDFLWATTSPLGDRTATGMDGYRKNNDPLVRLTLPAEDFESWPDITKRFLSWTAKHVRILERAAHEMGQSDARCWRARTEPLPLTRILRAEAKILYQQ